MHTARHTAESSTVQLSRIINVCYPNYLSEGGDFPVWGQLFERGKADIRARSYSSDVRYLIGEKFVGEK